MANSDKNILITPNINSSSSQPNIVFTGAGNSSITARMLDDSVGTLVFENSGNRLFTIDTNFTSGDTYSVINNQSKLPLFRTDINGNVYLSPHTGETNILGNGIRLPVYQNVNLPAGEEGLMVYDKTMQIVRIFNNQKWVNLGRTPIVTNGLSVRLDAGDLRSAPGNNSPFGSTWYDLSGFDNHCVWNNTPTYDYRGYWTFNGSTNYGTITNSTSNLSLDFSAEQTLIMVLRHTYTSGRRNPWNQAYGGFGTWTHEQGNNISWYFGDGGGDNNPYLGYGNISTPRLTWNMLCTVRNTTTYSWYQNQPASSGTGMALIYNNSPTHSYGTLTYSTSNISIGQGYAGYWQGDMGMVLCYKRALSAAEINQNYYAIRDRFGI